MVWSRRAWWYNMLVWTVVAVFTATQLYLKSGQSGPTNSWLAIFWVQLAVWWVWAFITPTIFKLAETFRIERKRIANALILLSISVLIVLVYLALYATIFLVANTVSISWSAFSNLYQVLFVNLFHWHFFICMAIVAVVHAYSYYKDSEAERVKGIQLEKELLSNQLRMLKMQLQPHFLFNTLNGIVSAIHQQKTEVASDMTTGLSELLRTALNDSGRPVVSLGEELNYVRKYLQIEQYRFKKAIITYEIPDEVLSVEVPNFFLQPIVENAVKHGIAKSLGGQALKIKAQLLADGQLQIDVYNDGPALSLGQNGIGIQNVRQRLHSHYGTSASLQLYNLDHGVNVLINLPAS